MSEHETRGMVQNQNTDGAGLSTTGHDHRYQEAQDQITTSSNGPNRSDHRTHGGCDHLAHGGGRHSSHLEDK